MKKQIHNAVCENDRIAEFFGTNAYHEYNEFIEDKKSFYLDRLKDCSTIIYANKGVICGALSYKTFDFDSRFFGQKTGMIIDYYVKKNISNREQQSIYESLSNELRTQIMKNKYVFVQAKIPSNDKLAIESLKNISFNPVSNDITYRLDLNMMVPKQPPGGKPLYCTKNDLDELYKIAKKSFSTTRFHCDKNITGEMADELQGTWIRNCFLDKLSDEIIIVKDEYNNINGFNAVKTLRIGKPLIGRIVLIAVDKNSRGRGIGTELISQGNSYFKGKLCKHVFAGTQAMNKPAINLYESNGFRNQASYVSMHLWVRKNE